MMSNRAELHRQKRDNEKKTKTLVMTREQLEILYKKAYEQAFIDASDTALILCTAIPIKILTLDEYWGPDCQEQLIGFMDYILQYYEKWQDGELDIQDLRQELWETTGVKFMEEYE